MIKIRQELDKETGYYYYNARHYDAALARFVTADTVIDGEYSVSGWNRYMYCAGNPVLYKDPSGHSWQTMQQEFRKGILGSQDTDSRLQTEQKVFDLERTGADCVDSLRSKLHDVRVESGWKTDIKGADQSALDSYIKSVYNESIPLFIQDKSNLIKLANGNYLPLEKNTSYHISSGYGMRKHPITGKQKFHAGVDIAAKLNPPIISVEDGVVDRIRTVKKHGNTGYGNAVYIDHGSYTTLYGHLDKIYDDVLPGAVIKKGQKIGIMGSTGTSSGDHCHFEVRMKNDKAYPDNTVNPLNYNYGR